MFTEMKDWMVSLVMDGDDFTDNAILALGGIAFVESSFFPIPPDFLFILMGVTRPESAFILATVLTIGSVLGGALGYWIGLLGGRPFVEWLTGLRFIKPIFSHEKFELVESYYQKYDFWAVLIAAFTPIPYKVFTIGGGLCRINFWRFMLVSLIGRGARFFLVGGVLYMWGDKAQFLLKRFDLFMAGMVVLIILGFLAIGLLKLKKSPKPEVE